MVIKLLFLTVLAGLFLLKKLFKIIFLFFKIYFWNQQIKYIK